MIFDAMTVSLEDFCLPGTRREDYINLTGTKTGQFPPQVPSACQGHQVQQRRHPGFNGVLPQAAQDGPDEELEPGTEAQGTER